MPSLWTKGHAMPNPSYAITSGFFANGSFFFFRAASFFLFFIRFVYLSLEIIPWEILNFLHIGSSHPFEYIIKVTPIHFHRFSKCRRSETASGSPPSAARSFKSCHAAAVSLNHSCNSSKVDNSASNFIRWSVILWMKYGWQSENSKSIV